MKKIQRLLAFMLAAFSVVPGAISVSADEIIIPQTNIADSVIDDLFVSNNILSRQFGNSALAGEHEMSLIQPSTAISGVSAAVLNVLNNIISISVDLDMNDFCDLIPQYQSNIYPSVSLPDISTFFKSGMNTVAAGTPETNTPVPDTFTDTASTMLQLVNNERAGNGLNPLVLDTTLTSMAKYKAKDMAAYGFSHEGSYGTLGDLLAMFNVNYTVAGENIAYGQSDVNEVMADWMNSQGHRENILNANFTKLGVGCYNDNGMLFWVQEFT